MAVSIPISMGYAQIAGLPAVYGLYGSVFPILLFALFSTSPQFIFGVDAAPAALIGGALIDLHIESGSEAALKVVPVLTLFVAVWLLAFYLMKAGKLVNYISAPVMGGFITGICTTIILMQVPKLFGGTAGTGELLELAGHIGNTLGQIHVPSLIMGVIALVILLAAKKLIPKFPMAVVLMAVGALMTKFLPVREWGIQTLSLMQTGLPRWKAVDLSAVPLKDAITISLSVAVVIMAETLLAENNFAQKKPLPDQRQSGIAGIFPWKFCSSSDRMLSDQRVRIKDRNGRTVSGENPADRNCGGNFHDDSAFVRNRIYRISSGSGAYRDCDLRIAWSHGI